MKWLTNRPLRVEPSENSLIVLICMLNLQLLVKVFSAIFFRDMGLFNYFFSDEYT